MAETSRNPESKMSAMESVTEGQSQPLSPLKKKQISITKAIQQKTRFCRKLAVPQTLTLSPDEIEEETRFCRELAVPQTLTLSPDEIEEFPSRPIELRETFGPLQLPFPRKPAQRFLQLEEKDFITPKLQLDKKRPLVISEQKKHTSELLQKFSVKEPPSQDQETEFRSRATSLGETFIRLQQPLLCKPDQQFLKPEKRAFITPKLQQKRPLVISEQKKHTSELLPKFSVKEPPSQDQETELKKDCPTSLLIYAEEQAKLQSQEQQDSDIGQETATKQSKHSDAATVVRFGAFGTIARQPNSMTLEVLACRDTEETIEEMFKYCQNNCLQILDFSGHQMKLESPTDLCLVVKTLGKKWVLLDSTKQTVSKEQLTEGFFGKSKWQFQTKQDEEDARSPARDELLCEIEIKPNDESIAYSEVNTVQLSVDFASLVDFPTCESNPETVTYNKEDTPTQTHLDKLLLDYKELAEELGEEFIKENTMQLENFAIGYFNEEGGTLSLNSHKVQLYIPRGALPSDRKEQVYIYVDPSGQLEDGNDSLSPVVRCGPPGLKFTESVVLSFPHSAGSSADLSALICEGTKGCPNDWQPLEDALISFNGNKAILLVDHFTRFGVGYKSRKIHIAAASDYVPSSGGCTVRLCVFNKSPRDLDDFAGKTKKADLVRHKGHVYAGIRNVSNGYEVRPKARQVFHWQQVWTVFKNTTTFYLISSASTFSIPICEVNCSQEALHSNQPWKGFDVSMKVTPGSPPLSELNRVGNEDAPCPNKPAQLTVGPECSPSTRPSDQLTSSLLEEIKDPTSVPKPDQESMKRQFAKNVLGDYGGLSSTGVSELCELLEAHREGESYWQVLAKYLFGPSERLIKKAQLKPNPAKEVLKVYFATKIGDEDAVENLTHVFRRLGFDEDVIRSTEDAETVSENSENDASKGNVALPTEAPSKAPFCAQSHSVPSRIRTDHEKILRQIASELGEEWERLATTLGVSSSKIFQLKENNRGGIENAMFQMLLWWHQGGGQLADLVYALDDVCRNDLATELQGMIKSNPALQSSRCLQRSKYCKTFWDRMKPSQLLEREQCDNEVLSAQPAENQGTPQKHMSKTLRKDVTLSEDTKRKLCKELNNKSADKDWESLLSDLCDVGPVFLKVARKKLKDPASAVLNTYFSIRSKGEAANTIKLMHLKEVFNRLHMSNALQILNEDDAIKGLPGCLPSHLQKVLKEFYLLRAHISENNLLGKIFQLPNIAIGYFDSVGGSLLLEDYGVHLYVPGGALPSGRVQQVYIYVDPNASPMDDVKPPKIVLSRMIQCGPPQLAFKRNVVLSFPYQATEDVKWTLITQVCQNDNETLRSWEGLEGDRVFLTKDEVIVLLDHFTGVRQIGMPNENVRCVGVYVPEIDGSSRTFEFRVRVWKNEEEAKKRVNDMEILKRSKLLDTERMLGFDPNKGDVVVDVKNISKPWQIEQSTENVITKDKVASFSENSVTFILERTVNPAPTSVFHFNVQVEQTGNGSRTTFVHRCHLAREGAGTPQDGVSCTCGTLHALELCTGCKEAMKENLAIKINVKDMLCSLPMKDLCQLLDNGTDNTSNSQGLARYLMGRFELNNNNTNFSAEDLLAIIFERCYKWGYSSQETVDLLIDALKSIQNAEAVRIVENYIRTEPMEF